MVAALLGWAWWPAGQYEPIRASDRGTIGQVGQLVAAEPAASRAPEPTAAAAPVAVPPGTHLAISLIPEGGATEADPAIFVITDPTGGGAPIAIASSTAPAPDDATQPAADTTAIPDDSTSDPDTSTAAAFSFGLPDAPGEDDSQALAVNRTDGGTTYSIAYSLVTVRDGEPVDEHNGAHAFANCTACTTVAVSFQVVLVVGSSKVVTPVNIAEALNGNCPACITTAIANQIVVSIGQEGINQVLIDHGVLPEPEPEDTEAPATSEPSAPVDDPAADPPAAEESTTEQPASTEPEPEEPAPAPEQAPEDTTTEPAPAPAPTG